MLRRLWKNVWNRTNRRLVGRDLEGNRFFEISTGPEQRPKRLVEYTTGNDTWTAAISLTRLPAQWSAWLSHSRAHPPTIEELQKEKLRLERLAINVARLKEEDEAERRRQQQSKMPSPQPPISSSISQPSPSATIPPPEAPPSRPIGPSAEPQPWVPRSAR